MAGKPELSTAPQQQAPGVQNVVVYVSNDNFAQAYTVGQQNVAPFTTQAGPQVNGSVAYTNPTTHSMASMVASTKTFVTKPFIKPTDFGDNVSIAQNSGYYHNSFQQSYHNNFDGSGLCKNTGFNVNVSAAGTDEQCEGYVTVMGAEGAPHVGAGSVVFPRCDSVRSETAESSCSSLSSGDSQGDGNGVVLVSQPSEVVAYDNSGVSVSVRGSGQTLGNLVLTMVPPVASPSAPLPTVTVPFGWKRLLTNGQVIYVSPSNTALNSLEQVKEYLLTQGTCKCGLECPLKTDAVFNYDPKVIGKPWVLTPDTVGDLTKLCNHKRKLLNMATLTSPGNKPALTPDSTKLRKDGSLKKKKRKIGGPFAAGVSVSQLLAQREKAALSQPAYIKDAHPNSQLQPQVWTSTGTTNNPQQFTTNYINRNPGFVENPSNVASNPAHTQQFIRYQNQDPQMNRVITGSPMVVGGTMIVQHPNGNVSQQQIQNQQIMQNHQLPPHNPQHMQQPQIQQHIIGANGQVISVQQQPNQQPQPSNGGQLVNPTGGHMIGVNSNGVVIQGPNVTMGQPNQGQVQQRIVMNGQPVDESRGPGRPQHPMQLVTTANGTVNPQDMNQRLNNQHMYGQPMQYPQNIQSDQGKIIAQPYDPSKNIRPHFSNGGAAFNGYRTDGMQQNNVFVQQNQQIIMQPNGNGVMLSQHPQHQQPKTPGWNQNQTRSPSTQASQHNVINSSSVVMPIQGNHVMASTPNVYERVPPLHQHTPSSPVWNEDMQRKKFKSTKSGKKQRMYSMLEHQRIPQMDMHTPCPNIDVRQIPGENNRPVMGNPNQFSQQQSSQNASSPSFLDDPSGYLAQQTALLNSTINRQTGVSSCANYMCHSPVQTSVQQGSPQNMIPISSQPNGVPLPSNMLQKQVQNYSNNRSNQNSSPNVNITKNIQITPANSPSSLPPHSQFNNQIPVQIIPDSSVLPDHAQSSHCQGCQHPDSQQQLPQQQTQPQQQQFHPHHQMQEITNNRPNQYPGKVQLQSFKLYQQQQQQSQSRPNSQPATPSSSGSVEDNPVTSSTFSERQMNVGYHSSPDSRPIQGGTVSTSNGSPVDGSPQMEGPPTNPSTPTPSSQSMDSPANSFPSNRESISTSRQGTPTSKQEFYSHSPNSGTPVTVTTRMNGQLYNVQAGIVTTMASGRTVGSNTITSVLAGRANTATVSINAPPNVPITNMSNVFTNQTNSNTMISTASGNTHPITVNVTKSPLEMVQSVVSSIQVPHAQNSGIIATSIPSNQQHHQQQHQQISPSHIIKHSPTQGLPPGHILVSSNGQLIMASTGTTQHGIMPPPPPKLVANHGGMPPISVSPMITNVTGAVTQVIPAVAQQVLGQQTVLVNALPTPFVIPGVTMTVDGMTVGQNMQIPHLVTGNVIQQQIQIGDGSQDPNRNQQVNRQPALLSPETNKKKGKKRKIPSQTVASMLHIAAQQNTGVVMQQPQQGFSPQSFQMAHSPQGLTTTPIMQALTIVPGKGGAPPQIVMNQQPTATAGHFGQQLITNAQAPQQINLLQPVNLLNGTTGMVQNFPTIQQFILPNLGGMVMNADGTATILQDTSNLGMQLQLQNVNGQNVLTPVQNNGAVFSGGQSILAAGPAGMVIRAPTTSQGKIIQQQHSPGAQFLSPNGGQFVVNGAQFSGQLSPLVANVSPTQQVTFSTAPQAVRPAASVQQQDFIQCGQMGQTLMVPCTPSGTIQVSTASNQQNTTFVQQNTTIVQQQTTMVSNNHQIQNFPAAGNQQQAPPQNGTTLNVDQHNFIINNGGQATDKQGNQIQTLLLQRHSPQTAAMLRHSVSTQTAVNQNSQAVTTNTFCQTSTLTNTASSPPDTTTHSPLAPGGQSPTTADTTTHSGSTDDGLSPSPSTCSIGGSCSDLVSLQTKQQSMAMVHCITSSEPDSADLNTQTDLEWPPSVRTRSSGGGITLHKSEFTDLGNGGGLVIGSSKKGGTPTHMAYVESSSIVSGVHYITEQQGKSPSEAQVVSSHQFEKAAHKRKHSDTLVVMETRHIATSLQEDEEEEDCSDDREAKSPHSFAVGDLIWGAAKGCPAWPGKLLEINGDKVLVRWFGGDKTPTEVDPYSLQTLSQGLDAHHRARKKYRKSRKLDTQLEKAIQEAMRELDRISEQIEDNSEKKPEPSANNKPSPTTPCKGPSVAQNIVKKTAGRLRSSQRLKTFYVEKFNDFANSAIGSNADQELYVNDCQTNINRPSEFGDRLFERGKMAEYSNGHLKMNSAALALQRPYFWVKPHIT